MVRLHTSHIRLIACGIMERIERTQAYTAIDSILLWRIGSAREAMALKVEMNHLVDGNVCLVDFQSIMSDEHIVFNRRAIPP